MGNRSAWPIILSFPFHSLPRRGYCWGKVRIMTTFLMKIKTIICLAIMSPLLFSCEPALSHKERMERKQLKHLRAIERKQQRHDMEVEIGKAVFEGEMEAERLKHLRAMELREMELREMELMGREHRVCCSTSLGINENCVGGEACTYTRGRHLHNRIRHLERKIDSLTEYVMMKKGE